MKKIKFIAITIIAIMAVMVFNSFEIAAGAASLASVGLLGAERKVFEHLKKTYGNAEFSNLRIEQTLTNSTGVYKFDLKDRNTLQANERGLAYNDLFVATRFGLFLIREDADRLGVAILQSYPNDQVFGSATGFTLADMETIYNGGLEIKVNQTVNAEFMPGYLFRNVPQTQKTASIVHSQFNILDMTVELPTFYEFSGDKTIDIKYSFPTLTTMQIASVTAGYNHKLVFMPFGFLIKNGARK